MKTEYSIEYVSRDDFSTLQNDWEKLERGEDMTYFQTFSWYRMLLEKDTTKDTKNHEVVFVKVADNAGALLICPLFIIKFPFRLVNRPGIFIYGSWGWTDYCNFIYDKLDQKVFVETLYQVSRKYNVIRWNFRSIKESTKLYSFVSNKYELFDEKTETCVHLIMPKNQEEYHKSLSKHSRQNLRTAMNRLHRDNINYTINHCDCLLNLNEFQKFRIDRLTQKVKPYKSSLLTSIKISIWKLLKYSFPDYIPFGSDKNCKYLSIKDSKGNLLAAFCYGYDLIHNEAVIMAACVNETYRFYSPGMVAMYDFIVSNLGLNMFKIDFTRGAEPYKYALGGEEHFIHHFSIKVIDCNNVSSSN